MLFDKIDEQTIALAGLYQSCHVVSKIAWNGEYYEKDFNPLINCILKINSTNTEDIYINISNLKTGLISFKKHTNLNHPYLSLSSLIRFERFSHHYKEQTLSFLTA